MDVDVAEWNIPHEFQAHHDHAGNPEEQNVEPGDERRGRVVGFEIGSLFRPPQRREGPEGGREPGVKDIRIAKEIFFPTGGTCSWGRSGDDRPGILRDD